MQSLLQRTTTKKMTRPEPNIDPSSNQLPRAFNRQVAKIELDNRVSFTIYENSLPLLIGRDPACDICIPANRISRQHCELYLFKSELYLKDISTNGTQVDDTKLRRDSLPIHHPINIYFSDYTMMTVTPLMVMQMR
jgi:pSer/pThr/pTyr-binding forkhead associated (FHA) protein